MIKEEISSADRQENEKQYVEDRDEPGAERRSKKYYLLGVISGSILTMTVLLVVVFLHRELFWGGGNAAAIKSLTDEAVIDKLADVENRIESSFLYEMEKEKLADDMFRGILAGLEDPYAAYYTEEELQTISELNEGEYHGIGITVFQDTLNGRFWIEGVYAGSPAALAGLEKGDEILSVDFESVEGMTLTDLVARIRQKDQMILGLRREEKELELPVEVSKVEIPTVSWEMLDQKIGYLKITEFDRITVEQFERGIKELKDRGMSGLILDVRDNPGGILDAVCEIMDDLLPEGLIVYTEDKNGNKEEYTSGKTQLYQGPLAVLVNENSASASEIFAGSLQDYELGPVIGTVTYGKGVVQRTYLLQDGSAMKLTVEKYFTAGGQDIDGKGIVPDIHVEMEETEETLQDRQLQAAMDYLLKECSKQKGWQ